MYWNYSTSAGGCTLPAGKEAGQKCVSQCAVACLSKPLFGLVHLHYVILWAFSNAMSFLIILFLVLTIGKSKTPNKYDPYLDHRTAEKAEKEEYILSDSSPLY